VIGPADPHGAGDALTAGVLAGLARGQSLVEAVRLGGAAGAVNVAGTAWAPAPARRCRC
jgi:1-phosphofructokinase